MSATGSSLALFALAAAITVATPGPTVLLALANGARGGLRGAAPGIAGALLSDLLLMAAVAAGLGALLAASEAAFAVLKLVGAAYLAWLGLGLLRARAAPSLDAGGGRQPGLAAQGDTAGQRFRRALLVALGNPKGLLFFSALLPPFIDTTAPQAPQWALLAAVFVLIDGAALLAWALAGERMARRPRAGGLVGIQRACGGLLLVLAGLLLAEPRRG
jgi:threonine/homoserine/homoserine lactone efflux protein